ncbi:MAG: DUF418 domain-containing protein [Actinobacteria bacterium]|nr:DUF418 domain-containing protein [Actinomycetota bacterium]
MKPERDLAPDVLRGFALLGILLVNIQFFAVDSAEGARGQWVEGFANGSAAFILFALFQGKFYLLFSFLYGYSSHYIIQGEKCNRRRWLKRCAFLMIIGALHFTFLWHGDILFAYGLFGLLLALFFFRQEKTIKRWAIGIFTVQVTLLTLVAAGIYLAERSNPDLEALPPTALDEVMRTGTYLESIAPRLELWVLGFFGSGVFIMGGLAFVAFLVGLRAARSSVLSNNGITVNTKRWMFIGYGYGIALQLVAGTIYLSNENARETSEAVYLISVLISLVGAPLLTMAYIATILRLLPRFSEKMTWMRAAGQMSLTSYLIQSSLQMLVFAPWGLGLFQKVDMWLVLIIGIAIWLLQIRFAHWWINRFGQGSMEKLMAKLTRKRALTN